METKSLRQFGNWAVYEDYIANALWSYELTLADLQSPIDWEFHLSEKTWYRADEFIAARDFLLWMATDPGVLR